MNAEEPRVSWVKPSLHVYGALSELTQTSSGCKTLGNPSDGFYLGNRRNPLTACST